MNEGEVSAAARDRRLAVGRRVDDDRARHRPRDVRGGADPRPAPLGVRVGLDDRARQGLRHRGHRRGDAAPPDAHRRGGPQPRLPLQDEPAAAHRGRPPGAHRGGPLRARSTASPPTTRRTRATRRRCRSSRRRWGSPGSRPPSRSSTPSSSCPACSTSRRSSSASAAARRRSASSARGSPSGAEANLTLCRPRGRVGGRGRGLGEPLGELLLRRPHASAAAC